MSASIPFFTTCEGTVFIEESKPWEGLNVGAQTVARFVKKMSTSISDVLQRSVTLGAGLFEGGTPEA